MTTPTLRYDEILEFFKRIDKNLSEPVVLCVIGSAATILMGQQERGTEDIDVWLQASELNPQTMRKSVEVAGLLFDPKEEFPEKGFVQIVRPGIVQVPGWDLSTRTWFGKKPDVLWEGNFLRVISPPPVSLIASKLLRFSEKDLQDCIWLLEHCCVADEEIMTALRMLPENRKEHAEENWTYLKSLLNFAYKP